MTFEYFSNFFNTTTTTTTAALTNKTICPTNTNICNSKTSSCFTSLSLKKLNSTTKTPATPTTTSATLSSSSRLSPMTLRRKIRKTSRRKRKRRRNGCLHKITENMVDNIGTVITATKTTASAPTTTTTCTSHKCKISVNKTRTTNLNSYINKFKTKKNCNNPRRRFYCTLRDRSASSSCINRTKSKTCSCSFSCCSNSCNCSCCRKKLNLIVKNIVSLLLSQKVLLNTRTKLSHATMFTTITSTKTKSFVNHDKRKKVQLQLKQEKLQQHTNLYALGNCFNKTKIKQREKSQCALVATKSCKNSTLLTTAEGKTTEIVTKQISASSFSSYLPATNCNSNNIFSTTLPKCKTSTASNKFTDLYSYTKFSSSTLSSSFSAGYSLTSLAPSRIFNELYGVIFMTLLVLSICHNNVLETSAASVKLSKRNVVAGSVATEQIIMSNNAVAASRLNEILNKRQHPPERIPMPYYQQLPQTSNSNNLHQPQFYLNQETLQEPLENKIEEEKNNHIFQPQNQPETLSIYEQQQPDEQSQQYQQHLTTQATLLNHDAAIETTYNHTFQSLSIIDGDLTVAVDASKNLMTIEEEMLVAAAGGAIGVGSNAVGLGNHLHNSNNGFESYDATARGLDGIDLMTHYAEANSMPIFDFGMPRNITARTGHTEAVIKCRVDRLDDKSVSWIRKRDLHILTVGTATYTSDKRFQVTESKDSREWTLHVKSPQARDSGIYECQVNTEPKMSMAFQLNVIEISPDAKAVIIGPADLHFKVGSAIILTCIVHQPSVKDIGPIYWYRGEYMITPFDINENTNQESEFLLAGVTPSQTTQNKVNILEQHHHHHNNDGLFGDTAVGLSVGTDTEQTQQILTNEITQDFSQRIAMESQLGDTMKSRLRISNAQSSDTGNYTCQPTTASSASVMVHVINDENPAAMQKSGANSFHFKHKVGLMPLVCATITVVIATLAVSLFSNIISNAEKEEEEEEGEGYVDDVVNCDCVSSAILTTTITRFPWIFRRT